ncbi:hypothetical protein GCM10014715_18390 [Streptomyces spiralis]|uniref:Uncharacterized protein n=1 Tax=Streptomyces spiralis TaxID=66376 RepID=A0A918ZRU1_9ACTN|nr:hypothetical protein [Streptomyces spiralis]GHE65148.1 hypothetical protein GCM10014715_18390 [Streptomyces spiralis]
MAQRKNTKPKPVPCPDCKGSGEVPTTVLVGRKRRAVGKQSGFCLTCLGTGEVPTDGE